jgi:hypothetical protein
MIESAQLPRVLDDIPHSRNASRRVPTVSLLFGHIRWEADKISYGLTTQMLDIETNSIVYRRILCNDSFSHSVSYSGSIPLPIAPC